MATMMKITVISLILLQVFSQKLLTQMDDNPVWDYLMLGEDWPGVCQSGMRQSPINIETSKIQPCSLPNNISLVFINETVNTTLVYKDNTLRESITEKVGFLYAPDANGIFQNYVLSNIHFHTFGEHNVNFAPSLLEMHMVFRARTPSALTNDSIAVVALRFKLKSANSKKDPRQVNILKFLNPRNYHVDLLLRFDDLFSGIINKPGQLFYHYKGSLTTPPCFEIVNWYVLEEVLEMNAEDYQPFFDHFYNEVLFSNGHGNFRKLQEINGRSVCSMRIPL